jgi:hypothetical protein
MLLAAWYIWWIRRQGVHDEHVPPHMIAAMSIRVITKNNTICMLSTNVTKRKSTWIKPKKFYVLVNIDASCKPWKEELVRLSEVMLRILLRRANIQSIMPLM